MGLDLDLGGSSLLLSSVFGVEDGVGPDRPAINVVSDWEGFEHCLLEPVACLVARHDCLS